VAGKLNLAVSALRWGEELQATVQAMLPRGHSAEVTDIYPGGRIVYSADPGEAQIFVRIARTTDPRAGGAWEESRQIPHCRPHQDLAVIAEFEGRTFVARTRIHRFRPASATPPAAADPLSIRLAAGLPPAAKVGLGQPCRNPTGRAPIRQSNNPVATTA
jgi:hypothetical protein